MIMVLIFKFHLKSTDHTHDNFVIYSSLVDLCEISTKLVKKLYVRNLLRMNSTTTTKKTSKQTKQKQKQDMTVPFARARAKLGGSIRLSAVTVLIAWWCFRPRLLIVKHTLIHLTSVNI